MIHKVNSQQWICCVVLGNLLVLIRVFRRALRKIIIDADLDLSMHCNLLEIPHKTSILTISNLYSELKFSTFIGSSSDWLQGIASEASQQPLQIMLNFSLPHLDTPLWLLDQFIYSTIPESWHKLLHIWRRIKLENWYM